MGMSDKIFEKITQLRATRSRNQKEYILSSMKDIITFEKILYYTYNPFLRYHIRKIPPEVYGTGFKELGTETWILLNKLVLRKITGNAARQTLFDYMNSLTPKACYILRLVVTKDLKAGVALKTINDVWPGLLPHQKVQLVNDWNLKHATYPMVVGPKIDGNRGEYKSGSFFSRSGKRIIGLDHLTNYLKSIRQPLDFSGELRDPSKSFSESSGIVRSGRTAKPGILYYIFDVPSYSHLPLIERLNIIKDIFEPMSMVPQPIVSFIPHAVVNDSEEVDNYYKLWRSQGFEGLVGKKLNSTYDDGKNHNWMRKVAGVSLERKIINWYESEKKPGTLGGIVISGGIKVGSGFSEFERKKYYNQPQLILGKYATIEAKELTKAGSLREPVFKEIRWDISV